MAGYLCLRATQTTVSKQLTIQARGLLAEEYRYAHRYEKNIIMHFLNRIRAYYFSHLEYHVYFKATHTPTCTVEAVSFALKEYIVQHFDANSQHITIADLDIPPACDIRDLQLWRKETRKHLDLPDNARVYCYNGSIKPWQCPELAIAFFKKQLHKNQQSFFLVLTQDVSPFVALLQKNGLSADTYRVLQVPHQKMYHYLAAADVGLLFRKPHIVNWTSRPTKLLEYKAVGLEIAHNDTVAYACELKSTPSNR